MLDAAADQKAPGVSRDALCRAARCERALANLQFKHLQDAHAELEEKNAQLKDGLAAACADLHRERAANVRLRTVNKNLQADLAQAKSRILELEASNASADRKLATTEKASRLEAEKSAAAGELALAQRKCAELEAKLTTFEAAAAMVLGMESRKKTKSARIATRMDPTSVSGVRACLIGSLALQRHPCCTALMTMKRRPRTQKRPTKRVAKRLPTRSHRRGSATVARSGDLVTQSKATLSRIDNRTMTRTRATRTRSGCLVMKRMHNRSMMDPKARRSPQRPVHV